MILLLYFVYRAVSPACISTYHPGRPEESTGTPRTSVIDSCKPPLGAGNCAQVSPAERPMLFPTQPLSRPSVGFAVMANSPLSSDPLLPAPFFSPACPRRVSRHIPQKHSKESATSPGPFNGAPEGSSFPVIPPG